MKIISLHLFPFFAFFLGVLAHPTAQFQERREIIPEYREVIQPYRKTEQRIQPVIEKGDIPLEIPPRETPSIRLAGRPGWNPAWGIGPVIPPAGFFFDLKVTSPALATPWPKRTPAPARSSLSTESNADVVHQPTPTVLESDSNRSDQNQLD